MVKQLYDYATIYKVIQFLEFQCYNGVRSSSFNKIHTVLINKYMSLKLYNFQESVNF